MQSTSSAFSGMAVVPAVDTCLTLDANAAFSLFSISGHAVQRWRRPCRPRGFLLARRACFPEAADIPRGLDTL